jgi:hypothetical protein
VGGPCEWCSSHADCLSGHACSNERAIPPWMGFIDDPDKYFGSDQVPDGFKLLDPSKMKDPQIKEILTFWYSKQETGGFGFKFHRDEKLNGKKRLRHDADSDSDSDADTDSDSRSDSNGKTASGQARQGRSKGKGKGKGKGKRVEKSEERWTDHIFPDSRRRKRRALMPNDDEEPGEEFDFDAVDQMASSDEEDMSTGIHQTKGPIRKTTLAPLSKQRKLGIDTATSAAIASDGPKVMESYQQEPVMTDERKSITTRAAQKIQEQLEKKRLEIDISTNAESTSKCLLLCFQVCE